MAIETLLVGGAEVIVGPSWNPRIPSVYQIESFSRCNLECPFCLTGIHKQPFDYVGSAMDMDLFKKIVERDLGGSKYVELQMRGEPTLNKNLLDMVMLLREKVFVGFSTHGNTLGVSRNLEAALNSHFLTVSIDAGCEAEYNKKRVGGSWSKLLHGLDALFSAKDLNLYPIIDLQLIETGYGWKHELEKLSELADEHGWQANIRSMHNTCKAWEDPSVVVVNNELCLNPWLSVSVKANGDVVACCMAFDDDPAMTYGNLNDASLEEIWNGDRVKEFRYKQLTNAAGLSGMAKELPKACQQCYSKSPALLHEKIVVDAYKWAAENW